MGWYLDTSLFMHFVQQNVRKGFDTARVQDGKTILKVEGIKAGRHTFVPVKSNGMIFAFELTDTINWLRCIQMSLGTRYYYSELTKAEVFRALRKTHMERTENEIVAWWKAFTWLLGDYQPVSLVSGTDEELSQLALAFPIRKNVQDHIHLITAKKAGLAFLTSDKLDGQIDKLRHSYHRHIYFWPEAKNHVPLDKEFWGLMKPNA